jgi:ABC-type lipoprotein release transport system permease subunit
MENLLTDLLIAARSLAQHTKRTLLLGGAIAAVTMLFVLLLGLSNGVRSTMIRSATTLMTGHVNIGGFYKVTAGQAAPVVTDYKKVIEDAKKILPDIDYVVHRGRGWAKLISETGSQQAGVGGLDIQNEPGFKKVVKVEQGNIDDLAQPNTILLFDSQAKKLDVKVGDAVTLSAPTTRGVNNTVDLKVVAIAEDIGLLSSFNIYIPTTTLRSLYQLNDDTTGAIYVYIKDIANATNDAAILRNGLEKAGYRMMDADANPFWKKFDSVNREEWTGQKLDVTTWDDEISFLTWTLKAIDGMTAILITILMVIVVVGIMNTMWIAIRERTREIGTLRAIGMQRGRVLRMFLTEALMLGVLGTGAGALAGGLIAGAVNAANINVTPAVRFFLMADHLNLLMQGSSVLRAVVLIAVVTTLAAIYPAMRASRLQPVTAMHHVG